MPGKMIAGVSYSEMNLNSRVVINAGEQMKNLTLMSQLHKNTLFEPL